jgi:D-beta-D-heptose 7-phosphate kinase / D-beta-D-heptose 1-phosphate adenosyltransferase
MLQAAHDCLTRVDRPRVCVIGDMMLDTYVTGRVDRVSPEGPIPVLHCNERETRPGGAASVSVMAAALGAECHPVGIVGADDTARTLRQALQDAGMSDAGLVESHERPTTGKTRFVGYVQSAGRAVQQLLRVDDESTAPLSPVETEAVLAAVTYAMTRSDVVVIENMGKGLLCPALIRQIIDDARNAGLPVIVDPQRGDDYTPYRGATCLVPNRYETQIASGFPLRNERDYHAAASAFLTQLELDCVVIKLDRDGLYYTMADGHTGLMSTHARAVSDVTGAGDMVAAALACAVPSGAAFPAAVALANFAAGLECGCPGATPLPKATVLRALSEELSPGLHKIVPRSELPARLEEQRQAGRTVAFTNGCFDLLHLGHVQLLRHAHDQADLLVVGLNTDASIRRIKGPDRPINPEHVRAGVLASLADVDYVVLFDEPSVLPLIEQLRPDVLVKGGDYDRDGVVGAEFIEAIGGRVELAPLADGFSTTDIITRIGQGRTNA